MDLGRGIHSGHWLRPFEIRNDVRIIPVQDIGFGQVMQKGMYVGEIVIAFYLQAGSGDSGGRDVIPSCDALLGQIFQKPAAYLSVQSDGTRTKAGFGAMF